MMIRTCELCGAVITQFDYVDYEHNQFNAVGYLFDEPMLCSKCWIDFKEYQKSKEERQ